MRCRIIPVSRLDFQRIRHIQSCDGDSFLSRRDSNTGIRIGKDSKAQAADLAATMNESYYCEILVLLQLAKIWISSPLFCCRVSVLKSKPGIP